MSDFVEDLPTQAVEDAQEEAVNTEPVQEAPSFVDPPELPLEERDMNPSHPLFETHYTVPECLKILNERYTRGTGERPFTKRQLTLAEERGDIKIDIVGRKRFLAKSEFGKFLARVEAGKVRS